MLGPITPFFQGERGKQMRELLEALGDSECAVADKLISESCQGLPRSAGGCPVSRYLFKKLDMDDAERGGLLSVETQPGGCYLRRHDQRRDIGKASLPSAVLTFINEFDNDQWPELVQTV